MRKISCNDSILVLIKRFVFLCVTLFILIAFESSVFADLLGIDWNSGNLVDISTIDASVTLIGSTGISSPATIEFSQNGTLYAFSAGSSPTLYSINPATASSTAIGSLGLGFVFEGGLAFSPNGIAYGVNGSGAVNPELFTIDLNTGTATVIGTISGGDHDINGLAWRSDGKLIGIDRVTNSLLIIDPVTAVSSVLATLTPTVGGIGGMTANGSNGYFSTEFSGLYAFDLFTGSYSLIGNNSSTGNYISGIAMTSVPEPSTILLLGAGLAGVGILRRRFKN